MNDKCNDFPNLQCIQNNLIELKDEIRELDTRLQEVEKKDSVRDEQIKNIFNAITDIKASIQNIADKLEKIQLKPADTSEKIKLVVITTIVTSVVSFIISKLILGFIK